MSNLRQAAQQALEALEERYVGPLRDRAIEALEAALAEPEQEPISLNEGRVTQYPDGRIGFGTLESVGAIGHAPAPRKPQTTHWEGCEAVHSECKTEQTVATWENKYGMKEWQVHAIRAGWMPAPTPRKPLSDEQMRALVGNVADIGGAIRIARAIERAHGIGEQT